MITTNTRHQHVNHFRSSKKKTRSGQKKRAKGRAIKAPGHSIIASPSQIVPSEVFTYLTYPFAGSIKSAGLQYMSQRWRTNDAFDVDPVLGSTATPGFAEWAAFFSFYRVISYSVVMQVTNNENFPVGLYVLNSTDDPGVTGANWYAKAASALGRTYQMAPKGTTGAQKTIRVAHTITEVVGSSAPETADTFRALVTSTPDDQTWFGVGIDSHSATNTLSNGVFYNLSMRLHVKFYGRKTLNN